MSDANEALANVRGWLCDNLSDGDAGEVCGMLSTVSWHVNTLESENDNLRRERDFYFDQVEENDKRHQIAYDNLARENDKLRNFTNRLWVLLSLNEPCFVWNGMVDEARELGIEVDDE